jgi:hypothetical protein
VCYLINWGWRGWLRFSAIDQSLHNHSELVWPPGIYCRGLTQSCQFFPILPGTAESGASEFGTCSSRSGYAVQCRHLASLPCDQLELGHPRRMTKKKCLGRLGRKILSRLWVPPALQAFTTEMDHRVSHEPPRTDQVSQKHVPKLLTHAYEVWAGQTPAYGIATLVPRCLEHVAPTSPKSQ